FPWVLLRSPVSRTLPVICFCGPRLQTLRESKLFCHSERSEESLWVLKSTEGEIPRHAECLGMTKIRVSPQPAESAWFDPNDRRISRHEKILGSPNLLTFERFGPLVRIVRANLAEDRRQEGGNGIPFPNIGRRA